MDNLQVGQATYTAAGGKAATSLIARGLEDLATKLENFSKQGFQMAATKAVAEAEHQAALDDANQKPYHSESVLTVYGKAYNNARSASYLSNAELNLSEMSNHYALQFKDDPEGYANSMQKYYKQLQNDAPTPELQSSIGIVGKKLANNQFGKLKLIEADRIATEQKYDFERSVELKLGAVVNAYAKGDLKTAELLEKGMTDHANTLVAEGVISTDEQKAYEVAATQIVRKGVLEHNIGLLLEEGKMDEAKAMVDEWNAEIQPGLTIKEHQEIQNSLNKLYNAEVKSRKAGNTAIQKQHSVLIDNAIYALEKGEDVTIDPTILASGSAKQKDRYARALVVNDIYSQHERYFANYTGSMNFIEYAESMIAQERAKPDSERVELQIIDALETRVAKTRAAWEKDPQTQAVTEGMAAPLVPLSINMASKDLAEQINIRWKQSQENIAHAGPKAFKLLTPDEVDRFAQDLERSSLDDAITILEKINSLPPQQAKAILTQLDTKQAGMYAVAGHLQSINKSDIARDIIRGSRIEVSEEDRGMNRTAARETVELAYHEDLPAAKFNGYMRAVDAYATSQGQAIKKDSDLITPVLGEVGTKNGRKIISPPGVTLDGFYDYLKTYKIPNRPDIETDLSVLGDFMDGDLQLVAIGEGRYFVKYKGNTKYEGYTDPTTGKEMKVVIKYEY